MQKVSRFNPQFSWLKTVDKVLKLVRSIMISFWVILITIVIIGIIWCEVTKKVWVIESIEVTKNMQDNGYTGLMVAEMLREELDSVRIFTTTRKETNDEGTLYQNLRNDSTLQNNEAPNIITTNEEDQYQIQIPGTGITIQTVIEPIADYLNPSRKIKGYVRQKGQTFIMNVQKGDNRLSSGDFNLQQLPQNLRAIAEDIWSLQDPYMAAQYCYKKLDTSKCIKILTSIIEKYSQKKQNRSDARLACLLLADINKSRMDYKGALTMCRKSIEIDPSFANAYNSLGEYLFHQKKFEEASNNFRKAIYFDPKMSISYINLGLLLQKINKNFDSAITMCKEALKVDPNCSQAYKRWGNILCDKKLFDSAKIKYEKAINLSSNPLTIYIDWGDALYSKADYQKAITIYNESIKIDPTNIEVFNQIGNCNKKLNKYPEAIELYKKCIRLDNKFIYAYTNLGSCLISIHNYKEAFTMIKRALELDSKYTFAFRVWGDYFFANKQYNEAISKYRKAVDIDSTNADAIRRWGEVLFKQGKFQQAIVKYEKAITLDKGDAKTYASYGNVLTKIARYHDALDMYSKASQIDSMSMNAEAVNGRNIAILNLEKMRKEGKNK